MKKQDNKKTPNISKAQEYGLNLDIFLDEKNQNQEPNQKPKQEPRRMQKQEPKKNQEQKQEPRQEQKQENTDPKQKIIRKQFDSVPAYNDRNLFEATDKDFDVAVPKNKPQKTDVLNITKQKQIDPKHKLKVMFLGGVGEIGKNMTLLEYMDEILVIDAGLTFPTEDMPGIDLVIPDTTYLEQNAEKVKGVVLTHGHEDHIGGLPFLLKKLPDVPLYGLQLTLAMLSHKFKEHKIETVKQNVVNYRDQVKLGCFTVEWIKMCHSIMDSASLYIKTPIGRIVHSGDFKIDYTPVDGVSGDLNRIAEIGNKGVLLYLGESTNAERKGHALSESMIGVHFDAIFRDSIGKRIIVATFSSNIHRIQQVLNAAEKYGRTVAFSGRSMINVLEVATRVGAMDVSKNKIVDIEKISNITDDKLCIITTGSQGEPMSALTRMASGEFNKIDLGENDVIVISASPIPGNERSVYRVVNNLYRKGAKVVYDAISDVHVSGHACQEELKLMLSLLKPKYFIPVHGEYRHLKIHGDLAQKMGVKQDRILLCDVGDCVEVTSTHIKKKGSVPSGQVLVDGAGVGDVGNVVLRDRKLLSEDGLVIVVVGIDVEEGVVSTGPEIISRGFVYMKEADELLKESKKVVLESISYLDLKVAHDSNLIKNNIRRYLKNFLYKKTGRNPMILTIVVDL